MSKISRNLTALVLLLTIVQITFAQTSPTKKPDETAAAFKKETVLFLRETAAEVNNLRSPENRISFSSELAGLMWFEDEKEARGMFQAVMVDFKQLITQYDSLLTQLDVSPDEVGRYGLFSGDETEKGKLNRKFRVAMGVRQQIAGSLAEHDPQLALDFFYDSLNAVTNAARRKQYTDQDKFFETKLLNEIAERDASKALELGRKSIAGGVGFMHIELLKKIYAKDVDKGVEFAEVMAGKLKDQPDNMYILSTVLRMGIQNFEQVKKEGSKKPMFSEQILRDLSETLAQTMLSGDSEEEALAYVDALEKFAPGRAAQIRAKFGKPATGDGSGMGSGSGYTTVPARDPSRFTVSGNSNTNVSGRGLNPTQQARLEREAADAETKRKAEEQAMNDVRKLDSKELPKAEREKIVTQVRKVVSDMGSKDQKIMALSMLAAQVAKAGDKDLAGEIMKDAAALVNPQPKNYKDFILVWMLASGYAEADPEKAFPVIQDGIYRLNDVITGVVRVAEFIDVGGEVVDDGEVQVGAFGGSMVRDLTRSLGMVNGTLRSLAKADLAKTKGLTNSFDRAEVRVLAKMMVLRAIMDNKPAKEEEDGFAGPGVLDSN